MSGVPINAYLDANLTKKLESFVINAIPQQTYRSDFNLIYIANIDTSVDENGNLIQTYITSDDSIFLAITNDFGHIDYTNIKTIHVAGAYETDFETTSFYPDPVDLPRFANYYEGNEVPVGGGILNVAFCPFGVNKVELLNGDIVHVYGNGKIKITTEQRGFKGYQQIPKVDRILSNGYYKIIKLAIYSRYSEFQRRKYSLNLFSPTMKFHSESIEGQLPITEERLLGYFTNDVTHDDNTGYKFIKNHKDSSLFLCDVTSGRQSLLTGIGDMVKVTKTGFIDLSNLGANIGDEFSIHMNVLLESYAPRGTILFEAGYGVTDSGYQTHKITLWVNNAGELCFNTQYNDEFQNTKHKIDLQKEHIITFTIENQKFDEEDDDEYVVFIHLNGSQIWPSSEMLTKTQKTYLWRAKEAWRVYNDVCMKLPAPHPVQGGVDAKQVCVKKLLAETGFVTYENVMKVYELYLKRPVASNVDLDEIKIGSSDETTIEKMFFGQDSEKDLLDDEYYMEGQFSEIAVFSPGLSKDEIEQIHLLNIIRIPTIML
jgi:hypothetical protein